MLGEDRRAASSAGDAGGWAEPLPADRGGGVPPSSEPSCPVGSIRPAHQGSSGMSVFRRRGEWVAKFQLRGEQHWVPGGPWPTKTAAREAERRHREQIELGRTDETCASFAERWLREWPRPATSTQRMYAYAIGRFAADFGPTKLGDVERLSARTWA